MTARDLWRPMRLAWLRYEIHVHFDRWAKSGYRDMPAHEAYMRFRDEWSRLNAEERHANGLS